MRIAITDNMEAEHKFQKYVEWILKGEPSPTVLKISYKLGNLVELDASDGVVITGGGDVDPRLYGGNPDHPALENVDSNRDSFERTVVDRAMALGIPLMGICRGLQLTNVHFGGTLIADLEESGLVNHSKSAVGEARHDIEVKGQSLLSSVAGIGRGAVNSYHHQAAMAAGNGLEVTARADDGVIEALELKEKEEKPFFLLVQWHPERMGDSDGHFSRKLLKRFTDAAQQHYERRQ